VLEDTARAFVSRYALGRDYHKVLRGRLQALADRMPRELGPFHYRVLTDSAPVMEVALAARSGLGWRGKHTLLLSRDAGSLFFLGELFVALDLAADEIIPRILIPLPARADTLRLHKVSKRSHLDIASFTAAMLMRRSGDRIDSIRIAYGGVGPMILRLPKTESFLTGKSFSLETLEEAGAIAKEEITPISDVRGSRDFRLQLAENVLRKFYYDVAS